MTIIEDIDISHLLKARDVFERFRKDMVTDRDKTGAAQAFEFCYELCWKVMKRVLEGRGLTVGSPKDTFRKAVHEQLIKDPEIWFAFQDARNLTVHTYNKENLEAIVAIFDIFSKEMDNLILKLKDLV
ncbi:MAG: nucleotidyltransferase substrate binding protein [Proteobacteria bacterium]|nr:nucleotidyltransferase substrate binding protein [Pseudomonadota bacterium]